MMLLAEGAQVGIVDVNEANMKKVSETAQARGYSLKTFVGDVSKKEEVERFMEAFVDTFGRIDILVNNAGIVINRPFFEKTAEDWMKTLGPFSRRRPRIG